MAYRFEYTDDAIDSIENAIEYLLYRVGGTGSAQAARNFAKNYRKLLNEMLVFSRQIFAAKNIVENS